VNLTRLKKRFAGASVTVAGSSWSLTPEQLELARSAGPVIAVNSTVFSAPFADILYACDHDWWACHYGQLMLTDFVGVHFAYDEASVLAGYADMQAHFPDGLPGNSSGHQAVQLAAQLGAARICCIGMDMSNGPEGQRHFHAGHPPECATPYYPADNWRAQFAELCERLAADGVAVTQCSAGFLALAGVSCKLQADWIKEAPSDECGQTKSEH